MPSYILALDQGTTSSRAILFDEQQNIIGIAQKEFTQHYPREGWVEHDPMEIYSSQYAVMMEVIAKSGVEVSDIRGIGITNQRETTILWDAKTGRPVYNAIVWQCRRTADRIDALSKQGLDGYIRQTTGLIPDAYFFCHQNRMDIGPHPERKGAGKGRGNFIRNGGQLADLEIDRRQGPCDRLHQCFPHHAVQHPHPRLG